MNRGPGKLFCARNCAPGLTCSEREVSDRSLSCSGLRCCRLWFRLWFDLPNRKNIIRITIVLQKPCYTQFLLLSSLSYRRKPRCPSTLFFTLSSRNILVSLVNLPTSLYLGQQPLCPLPLSAPRSSKRLRRTYIFVSGSTASLCPLLLSAPRSSKRLRRTYLFVSGSTASLCPLPLPAPRSSKRLRRTYLFVSGSTASLCPLPLSALRYSKRLRRTYLFVSGSTVPWCPLPLSAPRYSKRLRRTYLFVSESTVPWCPLPLSAPRYSKRLRRSLAGL